MRTEEEEKIKEEQFDLAISSMTMRYRDRKAMFDAGFQAGMDYAKNHGWIEKDWDDKSI